MDDQSSEKHHKKTIISKNGWKTLQKKTIKKIGENATKAIKTARLSYYDNLTKKKEKTNKSLFTAFSEFCTDKKISRIDHQSRDFQ